MEDFLLGRNQEYLLSNYHFFMNGQKERFETNNYLNSWIYMVKPGGVVRK